MYIHRRNQTQKGDEGAYEIQRNLNTRWVSEGVTRENIASVCKIPRGERGGNLITITMAMVRVGRAMQYGSSEDSVGSELWVTRGTREINESNRKQDVNAMQEKGQGGTGRELWPGVRPLWRLGSEMQKRCLWLVHRI